MLQSLYRGSPDPVPILVAECQSPSMAGLRYVHHTYAVRSVSQIIADLPSLTRRQLSQMYHRPTRLPRTTPRRSRRIPLPNPYPPLPTTQHPPHGRQRRWPPPPLPLSLPIRPNPFSPSTRIHRSLFTMVRLDLFLPLPKTQCFVRLSSSDYG